MSIVISTFSAVSAEGVTLLVTFFCLKMQLLWKFPHSKQFCMSIVQPEVEEEDKTEGSSSQRDHTKEEACCWHYCQHLYLKKENRCWNTYFWQVLSKRYCVVIPFFYEVCHIVVKAPGWPSPHRWQPQHQTKARAGRLPGSFRRTILFWGWAAVGGLSEVASGPKINPCESNSS